ncbi:fibronectin type III domain-containing protein [Longispora sp. K20-0274]|uniref:fibronectin type III domain-containing protein n=1 Tax=Longispora sp. K20-0274 TaxID=3088255 RepID=UPI003999C631
MSAPSPHQTDRRPRGRKRTAGDRPVSWASRILLGLCFLGGVLAAAPSLENLDWSPAVTTAVAGVFTLGAGAGLYWQFRGEHRQLRVIGVVMIIIGVLLSAGMTYRTSAQHARENAAPAPPVGLTARATFDSVALTWQDSPDDARVRAYELRRNGVRVLSGKTNRFDDTDATLAQGREYQYELTALGDNGRLSKPVPATVRLLVRSGTAPPQLLAATARSDRAVSLSWQPGPGAPAGVVYSVLRDGTELARSTAPGYEDATVRADTDYRYTVRAMDPRRPDEQSGDSNTAAVRTPAAGVGFPDQRGTTEGQSGATRPPTTPPNFRHAGSTQSTVSLAWSPSTPGSATLAGYRLRRDGGAPRDLGPTTYSTTDTGLGPGTSHTYTLTAVDQAGRESPPSPTLTLATLPADPPPHWVALTPATGSPTTAFQITGMGPPDSYIVMFVTVDGVEYDDALQIWTDANGAFHGNAAGDRYYLTNTGQGHDGALFLNGYGNLPLTPGVSYTLTFRLYAQLPGFTERATLTVT